MAEDNKKVYVDPKISYGHIMTMIMMLVAAIAFFQNQALSIEAVRHKSEIDDLKIQSQVDKTTQILKYLTEQIKEIKETG